MIDSPSEIRARVVFRKQLSDGNYGTESAEVAIDVPLGEVYDLSEGTIAETLATARRLVHAELSRSPSPNVVRALGEAKRIPIQATDDDDDESLPY